MKCPQMAPQLRLVALNDAGITSNATDSKEWPKGLTRRASEG